MIIFRKTLKVFIVEVKVIFCMFLAIFVLKIGLKIIASEEKMRKISLLGIKNIGPRPLGGARASALVKQT